MPPGKDRATAIGNMQKNFGEHRTSSSEDMITGIHKHTDTLVTILRSPIGRGVTRGSAIAEKVPCIQVEAQIRDWV